jgi:iron complex outermembrane recepter protein
MKQLYLTFLFIIIIGSTLFAQTGAISGTIKNTEGKPVELVNVIIEGTQQGATTNEEGVYRIENVQQGKYNLIFSCKSLPTKRLLLHPFP